jgi:hypothetical protein
MGSGNSNLTDVLHGQQENAALSGSATLAARLQL